MITGVTAQTLSTKDLDSENTLEEPNKIVPSMKKFAMEEKADWTTVIRPNTFSVYHFRNSNRRMNKLTTLLTGVLLTAAAGAVGGRSRRYDIRSEGKSICQL